jgi:hypothetical protein
LTVLPVLTRLRRVGQQVTGDLGDYLRGDQLRVVFEHDDDSGLDLVIGGRNGLQCRT